MIRDSVEDQMYLKATTPKEKVSPKGRPWMPTVDEVQRLSDQYYGPLKVTVLGRVLWHGSI